MKDAHWALNWLTLAFKVFAFVAAGLGLLLTIVIAIFGGGPEFPRPAAVIFLVGGFFYFIFFYTISEVVKLLMRMEINSRKD